ncbi:unnamed protein product [Rotaria sp. Silwood1]|nr:unnamed protein product [Rotaria sp. Silwood1]CAF4909601.1 unnamed protein product [Rotaria sp. Silwood1]
MCFFGCPTQIYNESSGPFFMNTNQFYTHFKLYTRLIDNKWAFLYRWFVLRHEYLQIELNENEISLKSEDTIEIRNRYYFFGNPNDLFYLVRHSDMGISDKIIYVRVPSECLARQLGFSSSDKSTFIRKIEHTFQLSYKISTIPFERNVIIQCGTLIGYLTRPSNDSDIVKHSIEYNLTKNFIYVFDISNPYSVNSICGLGALYMAILVFGIISCILLLLCPNTQSLIPIHPILKKQMQEAHIDSMKIFDELLLHTTLNNKYHNRLFLIRNDYLVMFMIDPNEDNLEILRQFHDNVPIIIISIYNIIRIRRDYIVTLNENYTQFFYFPHVSSLIEFNPSNWLHQHLMKMNSQYQHAHLRI